MSLKCSTSRMAAIEACISASVGGASYCPAAICATIDRRKPIARSQSSTAGGACRLFVVRSRSEWHLQRCRCSTRVRGGCKSPSALQVRGAAAAKSGPQSCHISGRWRPVSFAHVCKNLECFDAINAVAMDPPPPPPPRALNTHIRLKHQAMVLHELRTLCCNLVRPALLLLSVPVTLSSSDAPSVAPGALAALVIRARPLTHLCAHDAGRPGGALARRAQGMRAELLGLPVHTPIKRGCAIAEGVMRRNAEEIANLWLGSQH